MGPSPQLLQLSLGTQILTKMMWVNQDEVC